MEGKTDIVWPIQVQDQNCLLVILVVRQTGLCDIRSERPFLLDLQFVIVHE